MGFSRISNWGRLVRLWERREFRAFATPSARSIVEGASAFPVRRKKGASSFATKMWSWDGWSGTGAAKKWGTYGPDEGRVTRKARPALFPAFDCTTMVAWDRLSRPRLGVETTIWVGLAERMSEGSPSKVTWFSAIPASKPLPARVTGSPA